MELISRRLLGLISALLAPLGNSPVGARIHMGKTKLSRAKMCKKMLEAIQEYPGCKDVKEVSIAEVADTAAESIWRVTVDSGGVEIEKANHAARKVQQELRQQYELLAAD